MPVRIGRVRPSADVVQAIARELDVAKRAERRHVAVVAFQIECAMIGGAAFGGGAGSIMGTVVGSLIVGTLTMGLDMMNLNHLQLPIFLNALVLIGAVYLSQRQNKK